MILSSRLDIQKLDTDTDTDTFQTEILILIRYRYDTFGQKYRNFDTDTIVSKVSDPEYKLCTTQQPLFQVMSHKSDIRRKLPFNQKSALRIFCRDLRYYRIGIKMSILLHKSIVSVSCIEISVGKVSISVSVSKF